jgi:hypothetical protein
MMNAYAKIVPLPVRPKPFEFTGKRRTFAQRETMPLRWPTGRRYQHELLDAWLYVAREVLRRERVSVDILEVLRDAVFFKTGTIVAGNKRLARMCQCSVPTIERRLVHYGRLGVIDVKSEKPRKENGRIAQTRSIMPTFPADFDYSTICLPNDDDGPDTIVNGRQPPKFQDDVEFESDLSEPPF